MPCGCSGGRTQIESGPAVPVVAGDPDSGARYSVLAPDGTTTDFDRYLDAAVYRQQVNGTLTTYTHL